MNDFDPDGSCHECGDAFHLDDTGGYNPPCSCGCGRCRSCCAHEQAIEAEYGEDDDGGTAWMPDEAGR